MVQGNAVSFTDTETSAGPENDAAANLSYMLDVDGDRISGTLDAHVIYDTTTGFYNFEYQRTVSGTRQ